jgi:hypothetical protein
VLKIGPGAPVNVSEPSAPKTEGKPAADKAGDKPAEKPAAKPAVKS